MKSTISILFSLTIVCTGQTLKPPRAEQTDLNTESLLGEVDEGSVDTNDLEKDPIIDEKKPQPAKPVLEKKVIKPEDDSSQKTADAGIQIQVEKASTATGAGKASGEVKVYSPWPSKPLFSAPEGWKYVPADKHVAPYRTTVELGSGREVDLAITPYVLTPDANGFTSLSITEPGYVPELGYEQRDTIAATLLRSTADIKRNENQAAEAISRLQQLLATLPRPAVTPPPAPSESNQ